MGDLLLDAEAAIELADGVGDVLADGQVPLHTQYGQVFGAEEVAVPPKHRFVEVHQPHADWRMHDSHLWMAGHVDRYKYIVAETE